MDKYAKAVLAVLFLIAAPLVSAEVRITERDTEKIYQSLIANETWLSEVEVGSTVFERSWIDGCYESGVLMIQDNEVQLKWPEGKYEKLAFRINRVSDDVVSIELAINKGVADGADIPAKIATLLMSPTCEFYDDEVIKFKVFKVLSIEGLTDIGDILERAEHLKKIYAK